MESYDKLLDLAYEKVKQIGNLDDSRFEVPKLEGRYAGKKTILVNFLQIASYIRRDASHFLKYLLKELAASGNLENDKLILNKKVKREIVEAKIHRYVENFVLCKECKKPDTQIEKDGRFYFLHCLACGAKQPIKV